MLRTIATTALMAWTAAGGTLWGAETTTSSGPPAWREGASIYSMHNEPAARPLQQTAPEVDDDRRLAPPSSSAQDVRVQHASRQDHAAENAGRSASFGLPLNVVYTVASAMAIVIGVFLLFVWILRRGGRGTPPTLPAGVVSVLGRVPLEARQFAHLLRVGNKLLLISMTPTGAETLTEVTDSMEVDRIVGLCQQSHPHSTTKAFEQVFRQLSREPARGGFMNETLPSASTVPALDMFRAQLREAARA